MSTSYATICTHLTNRRQTNECDLLILWRTRSRSSHLLPKAPMSRVYETRTPRSFVLIRIRRLRSIKYFLFSTVLWHKLTSLRLSRRHRRTYRLFGAEQEYLQPHLAQWLPIRDQRRSDESIPWKNSVRAGECSLRSSRLSIFRQFLFWRWFQQRVSDPKVPAERRGHILQEA